MSNRSFVIGKKSLYLPLVLAGALTFIGALLNGSLQNAFGQNRGMQVRGEAVVLAVDDFESQQYEERYFVRDERTGEAHALQFADQVPEGFRTGARVTASGAEGAEGLTVHGADVNIEVPVDVNGGGAGGAIAGSATGAGAAGNDLSTATGNTTVSATSSTSAGMVIGQKAIVMLVNFRNAAIPCNRIGCNASVFGTINSVQSMYRETSYGHVSYSGTTVGPFTIAAASTDACPSPYLPTLYKWASEADAQATKAGVNLSGYTEKVYLLPYTTSCGGFKGYSTIGGSPGMAFVFDCGYTDLIAHEMGHNLGMNHASLPGNEYGDHSDIMGISLLAVRDLDAPHRVEFGWSSVRTVTAKGTYTIVPLEHNPAQSSLPQALRIYKANTNQYYYFSYRQPLGYDAVLPRLSTLYTSGVSVHVWSGGNAHTYYLKGLTDGVSFVDSTNHIAVKQLTHNSSGATLAVNMGAGVVSVATSSLSFANQTVGTASTTQTATFSNAGGAGIAVYSVGITGVHSQDFSVVSNTCGSALEPGASCEVSVKFNPIKSGARSAFVALSSEGGTQEVSLSGVAQ